MIIVQKKCQSSWKSFGIAIIMTHVKERQKRMRINRKWITLKLLAPNNNTKYWSLDVAGEGLTAFKPSDRAFNPQVDNRYYRLINKSDFYLAEEFKNPRKRPEISQVTFENTKFSRENSISVFDFFTPRVREANTFGVFVANPFLKMPKLLKSQAGRRLRSIRNGADRQWRTI